MNYICWLIWACCTCCMRWTSSKQAFCSSNLLFSLCPAISVCSGCCSWMPFLVSCSALLWHVESLQDHSKVLLHFLLLSCSSRGWTCCHPTPDTSCSVDYVLLADGSRLAWASRRSYACSRNISWEWIWFWSSDEGFKYRMVVWQGRGDVQQGDKTRLSGLRAMLHKLYEW